MDYTLFRVDGVNFPAKNSWSSEFFMSSTNYEFVYQFAYLSKNPAEILLLKMVSGKSWINWASHNCDEERGILWQAKDFLKVYHFYVLCRLFVAKSVFQLRENPTRDDDDWGNGPIEKGAPFRMPRSMKQVILYLHTIRSQGEIAIK